MELDSLEARSLNGRESKNQNATKARDKSEAIYKCCRKTFSSNYDLERHQGTTTHSKYQAHYKWYNKIVKEINEKGNENKEDEGGDGGAKGKIISE